MNTRHGTLPPASRAKGDTGPAPGPLWDAVVLGAGASGLFCAMSAAQRGRRVLLVDHAAKAGRKLSITGGGKCNVTNRHISPDDYDGGNPDFCRSALARFRPADLIALLEASGVGLEEREHGQMFCTRSAKDVVRFLVERCRAAGCAFAMEERVKGLERREDDCFAVRTDKRVHAGRNVVVALGGPAWPQVGATGTGQELARSLGHGVALVRPALAGLVLPQGSPLAGLAGIAVPATVRVVSGAGPVTRQSAGRERAMRNLALLFTHNGISGPAALQASLYWRPGMRLELDFLPALPEADGLSALLDAPGAGKSLCRTLFKKILPDRLCDALIPEGLGATRCAELGRAKREALCAAFRAHSVTPVAMEGFAKAEVSAGGVSTEQVSSKSMESRLVPGLYFCGEVLDVTGRLGGYNLHWAFASGKAAGEAL